MATNQEIYDRLRDLHNVLVYCTEVDTISFGKNKVFTPGERIVINQERGALFTQLASNNNQIFPHEVRDIKVGPVLELKIRSALNQVNATAWGGHSQDTILK